MRPLDGAPMRVESRIVECFCWKIFTLEVHFYFETKGESVLNDFILPCRVILKSYAEPGQASVISLRASTVLNAPLHAATVLERPPLVSTVLVPPPRVAAILGPPLRVAPVLDSYVM